MQKRHTSRLRNGNRWRGSLYWANKAIASARHGFNVARCIGIIAQDVAKLFDGSVQSVVEINKSVLCPHALAQFSAGDEDPGLFQECREDLQGLFLTTNAHPGLPEDPTGKVQLKGRETDDRLVRIGCTHCGLDVYRTHFWSRSWRNPRPPAEIKPNKTN